MHALSILNREFIARGWNRKPTGRLLAELAFGLTLALGGLAVVVVSRNLLLDGLGLLVSTMGTLGVSTNTHTSSHNATSNRRWVNRALTYFGYPFFLGTSVTYWWHKHIAVHHPTPNVVGFDADIDLLPFFALNEKELMDARGLRRWWFEHQWLFIPFVIALNYFNVQVTSWRYLASCLRDSKRRTASHWYDLATLLAYAAVWWVLPAFIFGVWPTLTLHVVRGALLGYALFIAFAPAHFPVEAAFLDKEHEDRAEYFRKMDFILLQTTTTVNFRTGWLGRLLCAGVEYQLEHHLFPGISHVYYPEMSPLLKRFCEEHGYPYRTLGWAESAWKALSVFRRQKRIEPRLEVLRGAPGRSSEPAGPRGLLGLRAMRERQA